MGSLPSPIGRAFLGGTDTKRHGGSPTRYTKPAHFTPLAGRESWDEGGADSKKNHPNTLNKRIIIIPTHTDREEETRPSGWGLW